MKDSIVEKKIRSENSFVVWLLEWEVVDIKLFYMIHIII